MAAVMKDKTSKDLNDQERSRLPGFDPLLHRSPVVDEFVEQSENGRLKIVYRTKLDITREALRRSAAAALKHG